VRDLRSDDGSVSIIVAVMLLSVMFPLLWIVVDGGGMFAERRQLQNAADAGALSAAQACSAQTDPATCSAGFMYAKSNSMVEGNDSFDSTSGRNAGVTYQQDPWYLCGTAVADQPCEKNADGTLTTYGTYDCPSTEPSGQYVQVRVVSGGEGWKGLVSDTTTREFACARALINGPQVVTSVDPGSSPSVSPIPIPGTSPNTQVIVTPAQYPSKGDVLAVTMSVCEWKSATADGTSYNKPTVIDFSSPEKCAGVSLLAGAFGGLEQAKGSGIQTGVVLGQTTSTITGNTESWDGLGRLLLRSPDTTWLIPLYDQSSAQGKNVTYRIIGFAAFRVTDFYLSQQYQRGNVSRDLDYHKLYGYFVGAVVCDGTTYVCSGSGGGDYGVQVPAMTSTTTYPGVPPTTYYTTYPGTPPSTYVTTVPGDPASAKPVL